MVVESSVAMEMWSPVNGDRSSVNDGRKLCEWQ